MPPLETPLPALAIETAGCRRFRGKVAVVTGAGQGIGRAVAHRLGLEGAQVLLVDRNAETGRAVSNELEELEVDTRLAVVDLTEPSGARDLVRQCLEAFGRIDVLVNNVGGTIKVQPFWEYDTEQIQAELDRSLLPTLWCTREVVPVMRRQGTGSIVNVGSNAPRGIYRVPYATAKGGVFALTTSLALELAKSGIRVNCVAPGATDVGPRPVPRNEQPLSDQERVWQQEVNGFFEHQIPMGRWGRAEEQAAAIAFMASDDASFITGQILSVAGGATVP